MPFRQIIAAVAAGLVLYACSSGASKEAVDAAETKVLAVHDEVMPKISDVLKLTKQLRQRTDSLDQLKATDASATVRIDEEKAQVRQLTRQLKEADSLMMGWMEGYHGDTLQQLKPEQALSYLTQQQTKINDVKQKLNNSISQARTYLTK